MIALRVHPFCLLILPSVSKDRSSNGPRGFISNGKGTGVERHVIAGRSKLWESSCSWGEAPLFLFACSGQIIIIHAMNAGKSVFKLESDG